MRARAAGAVALVSIGFGVATVVFASVAYTDVLEARANVPVARVLRFHDASVVDPTLPGYPALPDADHLPQSFTAQQREDATLWLEHMEHAAECMADAGFPGYRYYAHWQPGMVRGGQMAWMAGFSEEQVERASATMLGSPDAQGIGVDFDWQNAGCDGYGWHTVGIDYPVVY